MAKKRRVVKKKPVKPIVKDEEVKPVETVKEPESVAEPKAEQVKQVPEPPKPEAPEPPKEKVIPPLENQKVLWVTVCFSNGKRWKIGAKNVARRIADTATRNDEPSETKKQKWQAIYEQAFRYPKLLMQELSMMNWVELSMNAVAFEAAKEVDYMEEFKGAIKGFILEESPKEDVRPPKVEQQVNLPPLVIDPDEEEQDDYKTVGSGEDD